MIESPNFYHQELERRKPADRVVVTAIDGETSLGNIEETFQGLKEGKTGLQRINPPVNATTNVVALNTYTVEDAGAYIRENLSRERRKGLTEKRFSSPTLIAVAVAHRMMRDNGMLDENGELSTDFDRRTFGNMISSSAGGIDMFADIAETLHEVELNPKTHITSHNRVVNSRYISPFAILRVEIEQVNAQVSSAVGAQGYSTVDVQACDTGLASFVNGYNAIRKGDAKVALVGGVDSLSRRLDVNIGAFGRSGALAPGDDPTRRNVLQADREGFRLGEGIAVAVLEDLEHAKARGATILAEVTGVSKTVDGGTKPTELEAENIGYSLASAWVTRRLEEGEPVDALPDVIVGHLTGTGYGDRVEPEGYRLAFGSEGISLIPVVANKEGLGHTLGASGALNAVNAIQMIQKGIILPFAGQENRDPAVSDLKLLTHPEEKDVKRAVAFSGGFGGFMSTVVLAAYRE